MEIETISQENKIFLNENGVKKYEFDVDGVLNEKSTNVCSTRNTKKNFVSNVNNFLVMD